MTSSSQKPKTSCCRSKHGCRIGRQGITVKALIGGANLVASAVGRAEIVFCFDEVEGASQVRTWQEIADRLDPSMNSEPTRPQIHP